MSEPAKILINVDPSLFQNEKFIQDFSRVLGEENLNSAVEQISDASAGSNSGKTFTEAEIARMTDAEYEDNREQIMKNELKK